MWDDDVIQAIFNEAERGYVEAQLTLARAYCGGRTINGVTYPTDDAEAIRYYTLAAGQGEPNALNELGVMYENGRGTEKNLAKAAELFQLAADAGDSFGERNLARYYVSGEVLANNLELAFELMLRSAKQGNKWSIFDVALMYAKGQGTEKNQEEATAWFRTAAEIGNPAANLNLANRYFSGIGVAKNNEEGGKCLLRAAELGDNRAQGKLGILFGRGENGFPKDEAESFKWFKQAAESGHPESMVHVARAYRDGLGTQKDVQAAIFWYQKLIALPAKDIVLWGGIFDIFPSPDHAYIELGQIYLDPKYNATNGELAEECLKNAWDEGGWIDAAIELGKGYLLGIVLTKDDAKAFYWFKRAHDSCVENELQKFEEEVSGWLSYCYEAGIGTTRNPSLAFELYKPYADYGEIWAQLKIAHYFELGLGIPRDYQQAYFWANIAAVNGDEKSVALRNSLESKLTKSQIAESQRATAKWKPSPRSTP